MEILDRLSSRKGDRTEDSNRIVAQQCLADPRLLADIAVGLEDTDKKLQADCAEVFTMVAEKKPELVVPYADNILPLLSNRETKTRWEAAKIVKRTGKTDGDTAPCRDRRSIVRHCAPHDTFPKIEN